MSLTGTALRPRRYALIRWRILDRTRLARLCQPGLQMAGILPRKESCLKGTGAGSYPSERSSEPSRESIFRYNVLRHRRS